MPPSDLKFDLLSTKNMVSNSIATTSIASNSSIVGSNLLINAAPKILSTSSASIDLSYVTGGLTNHRNGGMGITLSPDGTEIAWTAEGLGPRSQLFIYRYNETTKVWSEIAVFSTQNEYLYAERARFTSCGNYISAQDGGVLITTNIIVMVVKEMALVWPNACPTAIGRAVRTYALRPGGYTYAHIVSSGGNYVVILTTTAYSRRERPFRNS